MIRTTQQTSVAAASNYFKDEVKQDKLGRYLSAESQRHRPTWGGKLSERLNLPEHVTEQDFRQMLAKRDPVTHQPLGARVAQNARVGMDITFAAPKSFSLLSEYSQDPRLQEVFVEACRYTMSLIEKDAAVRLRSEGRDSNLTTGEFSYAEFVHYTARPEKVNMPDGTTRELSDAHLHMHAFVINTTFCPESEKYKALQLGAVMEKMPFFEAVFHAKMAKDTLQLGYDIERKGKFWEIKGVSRETIEHFSNRHKVANSLDKEARSRVDSGETAKSKLDMPLEEWRELTMQRFNAQGRDEFEAVMHHQLNDGDNTFQPITPGEALNRAVEHCFERNEVLKESDLLENALRHATGSFDLEDILEEYEQRTDFHVADRHEGRLVTHNSIYERSKVLQDTVQARRGQYPALNENPYEIQQSIKNGKSFDLSRDQLNVVEHVKNSRDFIVGIQGRAGAGKTTAFAEVIPAVQEGLDGRQVHVFAQSRKAVQSLKADGEEYGCQPMQDAKTLAKLEKSVKLQDNIKAGDVIFVDEASFIGIRQAEFLVELAASKDARMVWSGDTQQHRGVEAGATFESFQDRGVIDCANVDEIKRQRDPDYLEAVKLVASGNRYGGLMKLQEDGKIKEYAEDSDRLNALIERFNEIRESGKSSIVICPTHAEGGVITQALRESLVERNELDTDKSATIPIHVDKGLTLAEKKDIAQYNAGDILTIELTNGSFNKGDKFEIVKAENGSVVVKSDDDQISIPLDSADAFSVSETQEINICVGEEVRTTRQCTDLSERSMERAESLKVVGFSRDQSTIKLETADGQQRSLPADAGLLNYGYVSTSPASQGGTFDHVLAYQTLNSAGAMSDEQLYVTMSRGRDSCELFVDSLDDQMEFLLGDRHLYSALDLVEIEAEREQQTEHEVDLTLDETSLSYEDALLEMSKAIDDGLVNDVDLSLQVREEELKQDHELRYKTLDMKTTSLSYEDAIEELSDGLESGDIEGETLALKADEIELEHAFDQVCDAFELELAMSGHDLEKDEPSNDVVLDGIELMSLDSESYYDREYDPSYSDMPPHDLEDIPFDPNYYEQEMERVQSLEQQPFEQPQRQPQRSGRDDYELEL